MVRRSNVTAKQTARKSASGGRNSSSPSSNPSSQSVTDSSLPSTPDQPPPAQGSGRRRQQNPQRNFATKRVIEKRPWDPSYRSEEDKKNNPKRNAIPAAPFARLVKDGLINAADMNGTDPCRIQRGALTILQIAAEAYLVNLFEDLQLLTIHARRKTLMSADFMTLKRLRRQNGDRVMLELK